MRVVLHQRGLERLLELRRGQARGEKFRLLLRGHLADRLVAEVKGLGQLDDGCRLRSHVAVPPEGQQDPPAPLAIRELLEDAPSVPLRHGL